jgi:CMP-N-acetylneuraminate monooxygenase
MTNLTINYSGTFATNYDHTLRPDPILLKDLTYGYNYVDRFIIYVNSDNNVEWVISRLCDHANGTLQPCDNKKQAECPLHGWKLDLTTLRYNNVNVLKETLDFQIKEDELIINHNKAYLQFPEHLRKQADNQTFTVRFLAHASLLIHCGNITLVTDPWLQGPCFLNGWWHKPCPTDDAMQQLLAADLIYISHNHADHMHIETLECLLKQRPDIPIITPNFKSKSTERPLKNMGFSNIHTLTFNQLFEIGDEGLHVSILKSGDFRDDSGLYIHFNDKQLLATVDSSNLNQLVLPQHLDLLTTSYAAGASGHPWCFDHYNHEQKTMITKKRHQSVKNAITEYIKACKPKAYMPYAGYFEESAIRDHYIKENNQKIKPNDVKELVHQIDKKITFIDPTLNDQIFISKSIHCKPSGIIRDSHYQQDYIDTYISREFRPNENDFNELIYTYFENTEFKDDLLLYLIPCDENFHYLSNATSIDFSLKNIKLQTYQNEKDLYSDYKLPTDNKRKLLLRVRAPQLWDVISNKKSWEELSIGFHCRIHRKPDFYNSDFWYYFSNCYVE